MLALIIMNEGLFQIVGFQKLAKASITSNSNLKASGYIIRFRSADNPSVIHSTIRTPKQILLDLIGSGRLPSTTTDWDTPRVHSAVARMNNKTFTAVVKFHKAGDTYLATEQSSAVLDGTAKVGDTLTFKQDGCNFESFINCMITEDELDRQDQNELIAQMAARQFGQFNNAFGNDNPFAVNANPFGAPAVVIEQMPVDESSDNEDTLTEEDLKALAEQG